MKKIIPFILIILFSIPAVISLFHAGFFLSADGNWMVIRFSAFYEVLRHGQIPVRFLPRLNFGYGYPVADFLYPLFMYLATPIKLLGFSFVASIKILFGFSLIGSGIFSYMWLKQLFTKQAAFAGGLIFMLFPYHIFDIYQRGSVGEILALAIIPLILFCIEKRWHAGIGIGIGLLILAHNVLALLFLPILLGYMMLRKIAFQKILLVTFLGLAVSAFFWIPALYDRQFTVFNAIKISDISQYFLSLQSLGLLGAIFLVVFLTLFYKLSKPSLFFLIVTMLSVFFATSFSNFIWKIIPLGTYIQFPFRFLSVTVLGTAFLGGYAIDQLKEKKQFILIVVSLLFLFISSWNFFFPVVFQYHPDTFYSTNQDTTTVKNEYMPLWVKYAPTQQAKEKTEIISGRGAVSNIIQKGNRISFAVHVKQTTKVQINTVYFPGWKVWVDGKVTAIQYKENGLIRFTLNPGRHIIKAEFGETPLRLVNDGISVIGMIMAVAFILNRRQHKKNNL